MDDLATQGTKTTEAMPAYLTVVFKIEDQAAFDAFYRCTLHPLIRFGKPAPYQMTGWAIDDELYRSSLYHEAMEHAATYEALTEAMEAIFQCSNLKDWDWEKWDNG